MEGQGREGGGEEEERGREEGKDRGRVEGDVREEEGRGRKE